jgi:hypothetical protein
MHRHRSRLAVGLAAAVVIGSMLLPLAAGAATVKLDRSASGMRATTATVTSGSAETRTRTGILGSIYYWTFVDALRYWKRYHNWD